MTDTSDTLVIYIGNEEITYDAALNLWVWNGTTYSDQAIGDKNGRNCRNGRNFRDCMA